MANEPLKQDPASPTTGANDTGHELDALLGRAFEEKSLFVDLYENLVDLFFPKKLPPLELTSQPIPVKDPLAVERNPWAIGISATVNILILCIVLFWVGKKVIDEIKKPNDATMLDLTDFKGVKSPNKAGGGGGGGEHSLVDPSKGKLPKFEKNPVTPPQVEVEKPKLAMDAAINVQTNLEIPDNPSMPNLGVKNSRNVTLASAGQGSGAGFGTGSGGGIGSGNGNGWGAGSGGNAGNGVYRVGGGISTPQLVRSVEAEFSDEARRAKYQGVCLVTIIVDAQGNVQNPRIVRPLGMGLDEKALEAIRQYKFKPALKDGKTPVPVQITIEVNFHLY